MNHAERAKVRDRKFESTQRSVHSFHEQSEAIELATVPVTALAGGSMDKGRPDLRVEANAGAGTVSQHHPRCTARTALPVRLRWSRT